MRPAALLLLVSLAPSAAAWSVVVGGGFFEPATLAIPPGEVVTFTSADRTPHTVTSTWDDGATFDAILRHGESFSFAFAEPGEYAIHCRPHAGMEMRVLVRAVEPEPAARIPAAPLALLTLAVALAAWPRRRRPRAR